MFIRAYLRASTAEQDASRARGALDAFAEANGFRIAARYVENESGSRLDRPELFRLLNDCDPGDVLLVEQVDRLSRLSSADWSKLRTEIEQRQIRIVSVDLPTSWNLVSPPDDFTARMFAAVNGMMLDVLAAVARKDYDDRRRRQSEGVIRAKTAGLYKGRLENVDRNAAIARSLRQGQTWREIMAATGCSRTLLAKITKRLQAEADSDLRVSTEQPTA